MEQRHTLSLVPGAPPGRAGRYHLGPGFPSQRAAGGTGSAMVSPRPAAVPVPTQCTLRRERPGRRAVSQPGGGDWASESRSPARAGRRRRPPCCQPGGLRRGASRVRGAAPLAGLRLRLEAAGPGPSLRLSAEPPPRRMRPASHGDPVGTGTESLAARRRVLTRTVTAAPARSEVAGPAQSPGSRPGRPGRRDPGPEPGRGVRVRCRNWRPHWHCDWPGPRAPASRVTSRRRPSRSGSPAA